MVIQYVLRDFLDENFGVNCWKVRHSINWLESAKKAKAKRLDPNKAWSVSILIDKKTKHWSMPKHAVEGQLDLIPAVEAEFAHKFTKRAARK